MAKHEFIEQANPPSYKIVPQYLDSLHNVH